MDSFNQGVSQADRVARCPRCPKICRERGLNKHTVCLEVPRRRDPLNAGNGEEDMLSLMTQAGDGEDSTRSNSRSGENAYF